MQVLHFGREVTKRKKKTKQINETYAVVGAVQKTNGELAEKSRRGTL